MSRLWLLAAAVLLAACQDALPPNQCVTGWPVESAPVELAQPLTGVQPQILWRTRVTGTTTNDWLLVNERNVAFTAGARLYLFDFEGNRVAARTSAALERVTSAVSDREGNYYFVGRNAYSVDPAGELRWLVPLSESVADAPSATGRLLLGPDGGLFFGASDGYLYALEASDGRTRWRRRLAGDGERPPIVIAGAGNAVLAIARGSETRPQLWSTATGEPLAHFHGPGGERYGAMLGRTLGIVTQRMEDRGGPYPWMHISVLDSCSAERWTVEATRPQWPALIGPGDQLYVVERDDVTNSPTYVSIYAPDGTRTAGPAPMPPPWGIGADGTIYALACDTPGYDGPSRLYAYGPDLEQRWELPLGDGCPYAGPVIDAQGRLYFTWYIDGVTELVAVQTESPGLAESSWPTRRRDARGTGWLE